MNEQEIKDRIKELKTKYCDFEFEIPLYIIDEINYLENKLNNL